MRRVVSLASRLTYNQLRILVIAFLVLTAFVYLRSGSNQVENNVQVVRRIDLSTISDDNVHDETSLKVYTFNDDKWLRNKTVCSHLEQLKGLPTFKLLAMHSDKDPNGHIKIYGFDPAHDWISAAINEKNAFESIVFKMIYMNVKDDPDIHFLDLGANIGTFTLQVADMGRRVISLEVSHECTQHICASLLANNLQDKVTIIHNAIGKDHTDLKLVRTKQGNMGINFIDTEDNQRLIARKTEDHKEWFKNIEKITYKSTVLDDLLTLPEMKDIKKVFLKIDVEGFEHFALQGGEELFKNIVIKGIYMEWDKHYNQPPGDWIYNTLTKKGFVAFNCQLTHDNSNLVYSKDLPCIRSDRKDLRQLIDNVLWLPKNRLDH